MSLPGPNLVADQELIARCPWRRLAPAHLLTVMTKFLYLGWGLADIIRAVTARPAELLGMDGIIGTLRPGAQADIAVLAMDEAPVELFDIYKERRRHSTARCVASRRSSRADP